MTVYGDFEYERALDKLQRAAARSGNTPGDDTAISIYLGLLHLELGDPANAEGDFKRPPQRQLRP